MQKYHSRVIYFILINKLLLGAVTTIDFETAGDGYTPSTIWGSGWENVFNRTNHNMTIVTNEDGYYWAVEDLSPTNPFIDLDQIDISGAASFTFSIDLVAHHYDDWDAADELLITYSLALTGMTYQMSEELK